MKFVIQGQIAIKISLKRRK